jgi:hypothetical protein
MSRQAERLLAFEERVECLCFFLTKGKQPEKQTTSTVPMPKVHYVIHFNSKLILRAVPQLHIKLNRFAT